MTLSTLADLSLFFLIACGNVTPRALPDGLSPPDASDPPPTVDAAIASPPPDATPPSQPPTCPNAVNSGYVDCNVRLKGYECVEAGPWENNVSGCTFTEPGVLPLKITVANCGDCQ